MQAEPTNFDARGAADFLGVSVGLIRQDIVTRRHRFPFVRVGRRVVYPRDLLTRWRNAHTENLPPENGNSPQKH